LHARHVVLPRAIAAVTPQREHGLFMTIMAHVFR
jgi:hypothetical protein